MRKLTLLLTLFALATLPAAAQSDMGTQEQIDRGKVVYDKYCSQCHGYEGDGNGYATGRVLPGPPLPITCTLRTSSRFDHAPASSTMNG